MFCRYLIVGVSRLKVSALFLCVAASISAVAGPAALAPTTILENYCVASRGQEQSVRGASMEVDIEASLPRLKKQGRLHALRHISTLGRITYEALRFDGDGTVKNQVIARYLTAEAEAQKERAPSLAVTPENYKFKYKASQPHGGPRRLCFPGRRRGRSARVYSRERSGSTPPPIFACRSPAIWSRILPFS